MGAPVTGNLVGCEVVGRGVGLEVGSDETGGSATKIGLVDGFGVGYLLGLAVGTREGDCVIGFSVGAAVGGARSCDSVGKLVVGWPVGTTDGGAKSSALGWLLNSTSKSLSDDDKINPFDVLKSSVGDSVGLSTSVLGE